MIEFPKMLYKDLEEDGDVNNPTNHRLVLDKAEEKKALSEGWKKTADEAVKGPSILARLSKLGKSEKKG